MLKTVFCTAILAAGTSMTSLAWASDVKVSASASINSPADQRVSDRVYDVRVKGDRNDTRNEVYDEALYKAAKKTRKKDYDWFRVIDSDIERETRIRDSQSGFEAEYERVPYRSCGLLTCKTEYRTERSTTIRIDADDREETRYVVDLDFQMGWGPMPRDGEVYDARALNR